MKCYNNSALQAAADGMVAYHEAKVEEMQQLQDDLDAAQARWVAASELSCLGGSIMPSQ